MLSFLHAQKTLLKTGLSHIFVIISEEVKLRRKISKNQLEQNIQNIEFCETFCLFKKVLGRLEPIFGKDFSINSKIILCHKIVLDS